MHGRTTIPCSLPKEDWVKGDKKLEDKSRGSVCVIRKLCTTKKAQNFLKLCTLNNCSAASYLPTWRGMLYRVEIDRQINESTAKKQEQGRERSEREGEKNKEVWIERNTDKLRNSI